MHIFLEGEKKAGKSTIINRFLSARTFRIGGFRTVRLAENGIVSVHMLRASGMDEPDESNIILIRDNGGFHPRIERFNELGSIILEESGGSDIIVMDELGPNESAAVFFQDAVMRCLYRDIPVIGVLQRARSDFLDKVKSHPNVRTIDVTEENRDSVPERLENLSNAFGRHVAGSE
jgi:nucleoside-triphosphatase THEP1